MPVTHSAHPEHNSLVPKPGMKDQRFEFLRYEVESSKERQARQVKGLRESMATFFVANMLVVTRLKHQIVSHDDLAVDQMASRIQLLQRNLKKLTFPTWWSWIFRNSTEMKILPAGFVELINFSSFIKRQKNRGCHLRVPLASFNFKGDTQL